MCVKYISTIPPSDLIVPLFAGKRGTFIQGGGMVNALDEKDD
jgi:hypothetical protein